MGGKEEKAGEAPPLASLSGSQSAEFLASSSSFSFFHPLLFLYLLLLLSFSGRASYVSGMRPRQKLEEEEERDYVRVSRGRVWRRRRRSNIFCPHLGAFATVYYGRNIVEAERGDTDDWQKRSISFSMGARVSLAILKEAKREKAKEKSHH